MATQKDIEKSLNSRMAQYKGEFPIDVEYPTVGYSPTSGTPYLKVDVLHGDPFQITVGTDAKDRGVGIYQITMNLLANTGGSEETTVLAQLKKYFKRGTVASYNGLNVRVTKFYLGSYASDADWYRRVVNVEFRADLLNDE